MMLTGNKKNHLAIMFIFYCLWSLWVIMSLSGCNQTTKNIPSASILVSGKATLLWNEIPGATSYNIYVSKSPGVTKLSGSKIPNVTNPFKITQLEPGKTYYFVVTMVNGSGESEESKELSYTAVADKIGLIYFKDLFDKSIPDHKSSTAEKGTVIIAWPKVPNAISYNIYWNDSPGVTKHNGKKISNVKSPHTIEGLKRGTTYYFVITSVNEFGESEESEELTSTVV
jgi:YHS domain-containing protein